MSERQLGELRALLRAALEVLSEIGAGDGSRPSLPVAPDGPDVSEREQRLQEQVQARSTIIAELQIQLDAAARRAVDRTMQVERLQEALRDVRNEELRKERWRIIDAALAVTADGEAE